MLKDRYSYVSIFSYDEDGISIEFPDLPGCYPCADKDDTEMALKNAKEALGLHIWGMEQDNDEIPEPTPITSLHLEANQIPVLVDVFMPPLPDEIEAIGRANKSIDENGTIPHEAEPTDDELKILDAYENGEEAYQPYISHENLKKELGLL